MRHGAWGGVDIDLGVGYGHDDYARSLAPYGRPVQLPRSGTWVLERSIEGTDRRDAMGLYPLCLCANWRGLEGDLARYESEWVSLSCVVGPFGPSSEALEEVGFDHVRTYKPHWIVDLSVDYDEAVSKHHRYYARRAVRDGIEARVASHPGEHLQAWSDLYGQLVERHDITGLQAFSREAFEKQFEVPGLVMFTAHHDGDLVAAHLWYEMGDVAYSHLAASSETGYDLQASYALHRKAMQYFDGRVDWLHLGGGTSEDGDDGLSWFKKGWATVAEPARLCGWIVQPDVYDELCQASGCTNESDYFPAYRAPHDS